jgi:hypothetical protein
MDSAFMNQMTQLLEARGIEVRRFEFPYMAARRAGRRPPPDRLPTLKATFAERYQDATVDGVPAFIGGKSMGGRVASLVADELGAAGVVCFGYPFFPPRAQKAGDAAVRRSLAADTRIAHLAKLSTPTLIVQGTRDPFGGREAITDLELRANVVWLEDADHDFVPRKRSGHTLEGHLREASEHAARFFREHARPSAP